MAPVLNVVNSVPKIIPNLTSEHSHRILVVDDTPSNTKLVAEFLKQCPVEVITCDSGTHAIALCSGQRFDLIFMDIHMPDADGFAVTAKIRELEIGETRTPIVALTAQSGLENKTKYIVGGMDDYLSKPVNYEDLIQLIAKWLGKKFLPPATDNPSSPKPANPTTHLAAPSNQPVVIVHECLKLAKDNPALARDMLQMLIDDLKQNAVDLFQLLANHNWPELQHFAHKLYGGACYSGVPALKEAAQLLDRDLQSGQLDNLEHKIAQLHLEIQRLLDWSENYDLDALFELA
jgi:two-component system sensor histidine kinase BarA